jgi:hypothetical protein
MRLGARDLARVALFALVGSSVFAHWLITDPTHDVSNDQSSWWHVIAFSAVIVLIAIGSVSVGRLLGRFARRPSLVSATGAGVASAANIVEDGLQMGWAFFVTVAGTAVLLLGLAATAVRAVVKARGRSSALALVPVGTAVAILLYVDAGGPIMLATWLFAAALVLRREPTP